MTLPASGPISFNNINVELGVSGTTQASLGQSSYRTLAGVASGQISMSNFYGKANQFSLTISSNQTNANLRSLAVAAGWNQSTKVVATINSGVYVYSTSTGTPALTIDGSFPGGIELVNNGFIAGMGGAGSYNWNSVNAGGSAISLGVNCTIVNNSYIGGGGGGGNCANGVGYGNGQGPTGGGGAGGGAGGYFNARGTGAAGGGPGASGANGDVYNWVNGKTVYTMGNGGGGGRIFPGVGGAGGTSGKFGYGGGAGGGGGTLSAGDGTGGTGGSGGSAGGTSTSYDPGGATWAGGGGGGWGAVGGAGGFPRSGGGAGGRAIALNGYTATRSGSGTTYGSVS